MEVVNRLSNDPFQGTELGKDPFKIRIAIASKGKGKSGGARDITIVRITSERVYLLSIYDKSEKDSLTEKELKALITAIPD